MDKENHISDSQGVFCKYIKNRKNSQFNLNIYSIIKRLPPESTTENGDPRRFARIFSSTGFSVSDQSFLWCFLAPPFYISIILLDIADFFLFIYNLLYELS